MPKCEVCGAFVARRKKLNPYTQQELANLDGYISVCGECFDECMRKCTAVLGEGRSTECKQTVCKDYFAAKYYAESEKGRQKGKVLRYQAVQPYMPRGSTSSWPKAPTTEPSWPNLK